MSDAETPLVALLHTWQSESRELLAALHPKPHPEGVLSAADLEQRRHALRRLRWTMLPRERRKQRFLAPRLRRHFFSDDDIAVLDELFERRLAFEKKFVLLRWADERSRRFDEELKQPRTPWIAAAAAPAAAVLDRLRDRLSTAPG